MDKVFPTGHREQSIRLVPRSLLKACCKMEWFWFIFRLLEAYFARYKVIATYFIRLAVCLWIFAVALRYKFKKSNSNSKRRPKC